ncbi:MAG: MFS transporter [Anaerolineales bacterium]|nr:MFS transporter [Anaerolineales bacterium]
MTTLTQPLPQTQDDTFQTGQVMTIAGGHFVHDSFSAFVAPLLPLLIEKLSLSLTLAGSLSGIMQLPSLLTPFIGYMADKVSVRYFIIFAPGITGTLMSVMGLANSYMGLAVLLLLSGFSTAAFHAPAPALIARVAGGKLGRGMSIFMASGELGRTVGPLLAVWGVTMWGLEGIYRLAILGWLVTAVLFVRFRETPARTQKTVGFRTLLPTAWRLFLGLFFITISRDFLAVSLGTFLPTFMSGQGVSLWLAGASLSIYEFAGVGGALFSGTVSDRFGRKPVLWIGFLISAVLMFLFINTSGWAVIPLLIGLGITVLSSQPVLLAIVQDQFPHHRAVANGTYMAIVFLVRSATTVIIGAIGDRYGLHTAFLWSSILAVLALGGIWSLPERKAS